MSSTDKAPPLSFIAFSNMFMLSLFGITICLNVYGIALLYTSKTLAAVTANTIPVFTFLMAVLLRFPAKCGLTSFGVQISIVLLAHHLTNFPDILHVLTSSFSTLRSLFKINRVWDMDCAFRLNKMQGTVYHCDAFIHISMDPWQFQYSNTISTIRVHGHHGSSRNYKFTNVDTSPLARKGGRRYYGGNPAVTEFLDKTCCNIFVLLYLSFLVPEVFCSCLLFKESANFNDRVLTSVPERWKVVCGNGTAFNSSKDFDYDSPRDFEVYEMDTSSTAAGKSVFTEAHFAYKIMLNHKKNQDFCPVDVPAPKYYQCDNDRMEAILLHKQTQLTVSAVIKHVSAVLQMALFYKVTSQSASLINNGLVQ
ncbi:hypothetical protein IFM89_027064 [Coptis chinensis]|uniref:WAT1-related protein n=1 Tax=Coptis chinensis TaxID=261450 RepID=A0A835GY27_9MAGN|nr:hypothetical protein IFM89_027064 [Coptis chinensis]